MRCFLFVTGCLQFSLSMSPKQVLLGHSKLVIKRCFGRWCDVYEKLKVT